MIQITLTGNVGQDPTQKEINSKKVVNFSVAVKNDYKTNDKYESEWYNCVCWNEKLSEIILKYVKKGSKVLVLGSVRKESYTNKNNEKVTDFKIQVDKLEFFNSVAETQNTTYETKETKTETAEPTPTPSEEDLPF